MVEFQQMRLPALGALCNVDTCRVDSKLFAVRLNSLEMVVLNSIYLPTYLCFQATTKIVPDIQVQRPLGLALWIIIVIIIVAIIIGIFLLCLIMLLLWKVGSYLMIRNKFITLSDTNSKSMRLSLSRVYSFFYCD